MNFECVSCSSRNEDEIFCPRCLNYCKRCVSKYKNEKQTVEYCKCGEYLGCEYCIDKDSWNGKRKIYECDSCKNK